MFWLIFLLIVACVHAAMIAYVPFTLFRMALVWAGLFGVAALLWKVLHINPL